MTDPIRPQTTRVAYADESYSDEGSAGFYILAATVVPAEHTETVREQMLRLRPRPTVPKLHWKDLAMPEKTTAVDAVAAFDQIHVVAIGAPVQPRRQERARAACMRHLIYQLHDLEVSHLICEARTTALDQADVRVALDARYGLPKGTTFRIDHQPGPSEPALWCADIIAGAFRRGRRGDTDLWRPLEPQAIVCEIQVD